MHRRNLLINESIFENPSFSNILTCVMEMSPIVLFIKGHLVNCQLLLSWVFILTLVVTENTLTGMRAIK